MRIQLEHDYGRCKRDRERDGGTHRQTQRQREVGYCERQRETETDRDRQEGWRGYCWIEKLAEETTDRGQGREEF